MGSSQQYLRVGLLLSCGIFLHVISNFSAQKSDSLTRNAASGVSGVTGKLPFLRLERRFEQERKFESVLSIHQERNYIGQKLNWGVCTTISELSNAITFVAATEGWHVVVVGDAKTPHPKTLQKNIHFLSLDAQKEFRHKAGAFVDKIPLNHFGRKNIGYLYAIYHGAKEIFDFDDDNFLKKSNHLAFLNTHVMEMSVQKGCLVGNPYPIMGAPSAGNVPAWPRGYPLEKIKSNCSQMLNEWSKTRSIDIFQYLADVDPDVDGVFRLTREIPFSFTSNLTDIIAIRAGIYVPFNAQATFFRYRSFWSLFLPVTVHGRVSDIWRSYVAQRILWEHGSQIGFLPPGVDQIRNAHNPLADMNAEADLYEKSLGLIELIDDWIPTKKHVPGMLEDLYILLFEYGVIEMEDVILIQDWLFALYKIGYNFTEGQALES